MKVYCNEKLEQYLSDQWEVITSTKYDKKAFIISLIEDGYIQPKQIYDMFETEIEDFFHDKFDGKYE